ncbi:hypothetical protein KR200_011647, partial [Drosophila serrata]
LPDSRLLARSLSQRSPILRQLISQKPLARMPACLQLEVTTARWFATKDVKDVIDVKDTKDVKASGPTTIGPDGNVLIPPVILKIVPARPSPNLSYDDRNMILGRELSPHLSIYKIQVTSLLSICLRMSGFVLAIFVWALGISGLFMEGDMEGFVKKAEDCDCPGVITASKVMVVAPFAYHTVAATRHMIWFLNMFLTIPEIYATGYVAVALSIALAVGLMVMDVEQKPKEQVDLSKKPKKGKGKQEPSKKDEKKNAKDDPKAKSKKE